MYHAQEHACILGHALQSTLSVPLDPLRSYILGHDKSDRPLSDPPSSKVSIALYEPN